MKARSAAESSRSTPERRPCPETVVSFIGFALFGCTTGKPMAQSVFDQLSQRLAGLMGEALGRSEELVIETNRCPHMSGHMFISINMSTVGLG